MSLEKIISGGQTGADRAALDAALASGTPVGGWCPRGRRAEDGPILPQYPLCETPSPVYAQRTAWNVQEGDATLILTLGPPTGGTALTIAEAKRLGRPLRLVRLDEAPDPEATRAWLDAHGIRMLNVAGPRASEQPGIYAAARTFMEALLDD